MGNFHNKENVDLEDEIDYIAANYILSNEKDLTQVVECNALVVKISTLLKNKLNGLQSTYLWNSKIKHISKAGTSEAGTGTSEAGTGTSEAGTGTSEAGTGTSEAGTGTSEAGTGTSEAGTGTSEAGAGTGTSEAGTGTSEAGTGTSETADKKCQEISEIAKLYVQIANIFAAITSSVYKTPVKKENDDEIEKPNPLKKKYFGEPYNFCSIRLKNLINNEDYTNLNNEKKIVVVNPAVCKMNKSAQKLADEPGILNLEQLYYDIYDWKKGEFVDMSENMKKEYKKNVNEFNAALHKEVKSNETFSDISLPDYTDGNKQICEEKGIYNVPYKGTLADNKFNDYAFHIKKMEKNTTLNQNKLLVILNEIFIIKKDKSITLNPHLNERKVQRLLETTRNLLIDLFVGCEKDYRKGLKLYQKIVDEQLKKIIPSQVKILNAEINKLLTSANTPEVAQPEKTAAKQIAKELLKINGGGQKRKIAYDFDGVIHTDVFKSDKNGQRSAKTNNIDVFVKHAFDKIIKKIKECHNEQFILSARNALSPIIKTLRKLGVTEEMIPDKNVLSAPSTGKWEVLRQKEINEFYDDSCLTIVHIQQNRHELPYLDKLYMTIPEKKEWHEIPKDAIINLQKCL
jgi:hypothetical protein